MFQLKICGLTDPADVPHVAASGADALGLNFAPQSKRFLTADRAAAIAAVIPLGIARVGVFVNATDAELLAAITSGKLDYLQLHGDETPSRVAEIARLAQANRLPLQLIKAFRLQSDPAAEIDPYLAQCVELGIKIAAILVDAFQPGEYGGTGQTVDWRTVAAWTTRPPIPLILAGGLTPANVAAAISITKSDGVDTAGGVELEPGRKAASLCHEFIQQARIAFSSIHGQQKRAFYGDR